MRLEVEDEVWVGNRRIWTLLGAPYTVGGVVRLGLRFRVEGLQREFPTMQRASFAACDAGPLPEESAAA